MPNSFFQPYRTSAKDSAKQPGFSGVGYGPAPTDDLTFATKDEVFKYQLQLPDPTALTEDSLLVAKICETSHYARSVHRTLTSIGVLDASHHPDTSRVDRRLVSKIGIISVPKQRELVNMLFWWEEEIQRWRVLENEKASLEKELGNPGESGADIAKKEVPARLEELELLRMVVPSQRRADGSITTIHPGQDEVDGREPPQYVP